MDQTGVNPWFHPFLNAAGITTLTGKRCFVPQSTVSVRSVLSVHMKAERGVTFHPLKLLTSPPKETPEGWVLEVTGDVALLRQGAVLVESPVDGTSQQYIGTSIPFRSIVLNPSLPLAV